jgi:hypothetical protein
MSLPATTLFPPFSHLRDSGPDSLVAWQPMDMTATALSSGEIAACVAGSSDGRHGRQQIA